MRKKIPREGTKAHANYLQKKKDKEELIIWKKNVKDAWDNKCSICGKTEKIQAHHIFLFRYFKEYRTELLNGIALCSGCHYRGRRSAHTNPLISYKMIWEKKPEQWLWIMEQLEKIQNEKNNEQR